MRKIGLLVAAGVLLAGAGCSGGDDTPDRAETAETTPSTAEPQDEGNEPTEVTQEALDSIILTLDDMPPGFSPVPDDDGEDPPTAFCNGVAPAVEVPEIAEAEAQFSADQLGPFIGSSAAVYESAEEADEYLDVFLAGVEECDGASEPDEEGVVTTFAPLSFEEVGDRTAAFRMTVEGDGFTGSGDFVLARLGPVLLLVAEIGVLEGADPERVAANLNLMLQRTEEVLSL